jgi:hypothetical protein
MYKFITSITNIDLIETDGATCATCVSLTDPIYTATYEMLKQQRYPLTVVCYRIDSQGNIGVYNEDTEVYEPVEIMNTIEGTLQIAGERYN